MNRHDQRTLRKRSARAPLILCSGLRCLLMTRKAVTATGDHDCKYPSQDARSASGTRVVIVDLLRESRRAVIPVLLLCIGYTPSSGTKTRSSSGLTGP